MVPCNCNRVIYLWLIKFSTGVKQPTGVQCKLESKSSNWNIPWLCKCCSDRINNHVTLISPSTLDCHFKFKLEPKPIRLYSQTLALTNLVRRWVQSVVTTRAVSKWRTQVRGWKPNSTSRRIPVFVDDELKFGKRRTRVAKPNRESS